MQGQVPAYSPVDEHPGPRGAPGAQGAQQQQQQQQQRAGAGNAALPPPVSGTYRPEQNGHGTAYSGMQPTHTETDPLATATSPYLGAHDFAAANQGEQQQQQQQHGDEAYTAISLGSPHDGTARGPGPIEYPPLPAHDDSTPPRTSLSTYNSLTQLRAVEAGGAYVPTSRHDDTGAYEMHADSRPVNPTVTIDSSAVNSARAERMYGSSEKRTASGSTPSSGYNSPRSASRDRSRGGGLGQWSGPAGNNSPYGRLGDQNDASASGFNSAASSNPNLQFADGDFIVSGKGNWFSRMVLAIYNSHYIVRWVIYILPLLIIIWIPGIIYFTAKPNGTIWTVPLYYWSIWLTIVWCGWWGAALTARLGPSVLKRTLGVIAPELRHYIAYVKAVQFYAGAAGWALTNWITFLPVIRSRATSDSSNNTLYLLTQGLFGVFLSLMVLLIEKLLIQIIAHNFHKRSYEDRIVEQKFQISTLVTLYLHAYRSRDIGRSDTLDGAMRPKKGRQMSDPTLLVKKALKGAQKAAQTATTVIGTVASEIAGERVLQPNSPASMVSAALQSSNKTKQLARRIYYSFTPRYRDGMVLADISRCFRNRDEADRAFAIFDRDGNGDATLDEIEMSCLDIHRERISLSRSMRDIDSAVSRLDNILISIWWIVAILIMLGLLNASFQTMITGAGTFILGLSWLIGTTAQEILASIIFLFIKHPYDVGDRVCIDTVDYTVLEMHLLSTVFKRIDGTVTQAPHSQLNLKFILNYRRSNFISETFTFDVDFGTTFEKIEALRARMLEFLQTERRDFRPFVDISVEDFAAQGKLSLSATINYRGNWQNVTLKMQRRNKWICALRVALAELQIFGPAGAGDPAPAAADPVKYTQVPWDEVKAADEAAAAKSAEAPTAPPAGGEDGPLRRAAMLGEQLVSNDAILAEEAGSGQGALRAKQGR
ncbi:hypothetical protein C6P46_004610 [Rhodotorula mucilaginosa]|uniref:EF-hand domain-containing protein n=1 Tax=Rhodotorula mucilaginosa TaxID=5537 RepID=A0A9P6W0G9_RHOMI|nr:hypothetical protein C6P46_004610 [Rhodotorula mucilaginosa]TKA53995.1 hypothetical protein B0A53_03275 [Rhodotorula sp. CCFEE 5036]